MRNKVYSESHSSVMNYRVVFSLIVLGSAGGLSAELIDLVKFRKKTFKSIDCSEYHPVVKEHTSLKAGPNLFGLFSVPERDREIYRQIVTLAIPVLVFMGFSVKTIAR